MFAAACFLLAAGDTFSFFAVMLGVSGLAIGVFKTGALALIGDISTSTAQHTSIMNTVEGFFGVGAIIGPAILTRMLAAGMSWKWLYVMAGTICVVLIVLALLVQYPRTVTPARGGVSTGTMRAMKNGYVLAFSGGAFLYVGVEAAIYVWMPTLMAGYAGSAVTLATYSISIFFLLRAAGRFLGAWVLTRVQWQTVLALFSGCILLCFALSVAGGMTGRCICSPCRVCSCLSSTRRSTRRESVVYRRQSTVQPQASFSSSPVYLLFLRRLRSALWPTPTVTSSTASGSPPASRRCSSSA